jgi:hypothetical protein
MSIRSATRQQLLHTKRKNHTRDHSHSLTEPYSNAQNIRNQPTANLPKHCRRQYSTSPKTRDTYLTPKKLERVIRSQVVVECSCLLTRHPALQTQLQPILWCTNFLILTTGGEQADQIMGCNSLQPLMPAMRSHLPSYPWKTI